MIYKPAWLLLTYAVQAIEISVRAITQDLRQTGVQVKHVGCRVAVEGLLQPVAQAGVAKRVRVRALRERLQPVGRVVGIRAHPIAGQVAVVVPGVRHAAHVDEPVGVIVGVHGRGRERRLRQAVVHLISRLPGDDIRTVAPQRRWALSVE